MLISACKSLTEYNNYILSITYIYKMILCSTKNESISLFSLAIKELQHHEKLQDLLICINSIIKSPKLFISDSIPHRVQKLKINKMLEDTHGELFGFAFMLCSKSTKENILQIKLAGASLGICSKINEDINSIIEIYKKNDLIDYFIHCIDLFRKLSIKTGIHNDVLEEIYKSQVALFKQQIKQY